MIGNTITKLLQNGLAFYSPISFRERTFFPFYYTKNVNVGNCGFEPVSGESLTSRYLENENKQDGGSQKASHETKGAFLWGSCSFTFRPRYYYRREFLDTSRRVNSTGIGSKKLQYCMYNGHALSSTLLRLGEWRIMFPWKGATPLVWVGAPGQGTMVSAQSWFHSSILRSGVFPLRKKKWLGRPRDGLLKVYLSWRLCSASCLRTFALASIR